MYQEAGLINLSELIARPENLKSKATKLQRSIAWETMVNRGWAGFAKYGVYFTFMWAAGVKYPEEARLLRSGNFYWRYVDDIADNDRPLPSRYKSRADYLQSKKATLGKLFFSPPQTIYGDKEDVLLADYQYVAQGLGIDLSQESFDILESIIFDEERARQRRLLTQKELDDYFELLDPACIKGALKVAGEVVDPGEFWPLSMAVRTMFNLRDFPKDFRDGLVNISKEDIEKYQVDLSQLKSRSTIGQMVSYGPIRGWYQDQVQMGLEYLDQSTTRLKRLDLQKVTRFVLGMHFEGPARKNLTSYARILSIEV